MYFGGKENEKIPTGGFTFGQQPAPPVNSVTTPTPPSLAPAGVSGTAGGFNFGNEGPAGGGAGTSPDAASSGPGFSVGEAASTAARGGSFGLPGMPTTFGMNAVPNLASLGLRGAQMVGMGPGTLAAVPFGLTNMATSLFANSLVDPATGLPVAQLATNPGIVQANESFDATAPARGDSSLTGRAINAIVDSNNNPNMPGGSTGGFSFGSNGSTISPTTGIISNSVGQATGRSQFGGEGDKNAPTPPTGPAPTGPGPGGPGTAGPGEAGQAPGEGPGAAPGGVGPGTGGTGGTAGSGGTGAGASAGDKRGGIVGQERARARAGDHPSAMKGPQRPSDARLIAKLDAGQKGSAQPAPPAGRVPMPSAEPSVGGMAVGQRFARGGAIETPMRLPKVHDRPMGLDNALAGRQSIPVMADRQPYSSGAEADPMEALIHTLSASQSLAKGGRVPYTATPEHQAMLQSAGGLTQDGNARSTTDDTKTVLEKGEYVLPRQAVSMLGMPLLEELRRRSLSTTGGMAVGQPYRR